MRAIRTVTWSLSAATVTYGDSTRRVETALRIPGAHFLSPRETDLATGPTGSDTRHFVEVFYWAPSTRSGPPWELRWRVYEIDRDNVVDVGGADALAWSDNADPPSDSSNVRDYARLAVDEQGRAQLVVLTGMHRGTELIPTDAERREVRDHEDARADALKHGDWTRQADVTRDPSMAYADSDGCGMIHVYGWSADRREAIAIDASPSALGVSGGRAVFDVSRASANIPVVVYVYATAARRFEFCSDFRGGRGPGYVEPEKWRAIARTLSVQLSRPGVRARQPLLRRATVTLSNVTLQNATGRTVTISGPIILTAIVGGAGG